MLGRASRDADGSVWPPLMRAMAKMGERWRFLLLLSGRGVWNCKKMPPQGGGELFATKDGSCKINNGFGGL